MIDFAKIAAGELTYAQLATSLNRDDLRALTNEMIDTIHAIIAGATDAYVTFVPSDPEANDTFAATADVVDLAWTLGHVVVHTTASSEESAALALNMARGLYIEGRSRSEVPWESVTTAEQMFKRLEESRRMRLAMLDAWPDRPYLEVTYQSPHRGEINTISRFLQGLSHDNSHLGQLRAIMEQCRTAQL